MRLKNGLISFMVCICIGISASSVSAKTGVSVNTAPFPVQFNGVTIDHVNAQYPLLLYKNITYVPMTWDYCQALALDVHWSQETGLTISKSTPKGIAADPAQSTSNANMQNASIPTFPITVNRKIIDNSKEPYPLLVYKDITYFPLTWRFAHDEFAWDAQWDRNNGLRIGTDQEQILNDIIYDNESFIYVDTNNGGITKIAKDLTGDPVALAETEVNSIKDLAIKSSNSTIVPFDVDATKKTDRVGNLIRYKGIDLLDLAASKSEKSLTIEKVATIGNDMDLVVIGVETNSGDPEKWWILNPFYLFVVKDGIAKQLPGINQSPTRVITSADGSVWVISDVDNGARTKHPFSQISLFQANGDVHALNTDLDAHDVEIVAIKNNSLIVHSFNNRFSPTIVKEKDGFYSIDTKYTIKKINQSNFESIYDDRDGNRFVVGKGNAVTRMNSSQTRKWWDYSLKKLLNMN